jgi:crossover junction endodeoxyribonuclease RuvC
MPEKSLTPRQGIVELSPVALLRPNSDTFRGDSLDLCMTRVLIAGFDPGLSRTGWGIIAVEGSKLSHVANGVITTVASHSLGKRLAILHHGICTILREHAPHAVAVEQAFVAKDPLAALKLGHARAIALLAAAEAGLEIAEYAPNHIKKSVVGVGHADKAQVQAMVRRLLPAVQFEAADAADALACAIAHAHLAGTRARIAALAR